MFNARADLVAHAAKLIQHLCLSAGCMGRIVKGPVGTFLYPAKKSRAAALGTATPGEEDSAAHVTAAPAGGGNETLGGDTSGEISGK